MAINVVSFSFSRAAQLGAWGPTPLGAGFLYHILSPTGLVSKLTDFLSSLSYIIVQLPTQSLEWHVWLSSSGSNCHAVHRSLSSGASVYDCTMGFYLVPYCQPSPPTWFLPITGHRDVSLPLPLEWHVWLSSSGNNCHAVHRSLSSGASVSDSTVGFYLVPYCQPSPPTPMEYATSASLE